MATHSIKFKEYALDNLFINSELSNDEYGYGNDPFQGVYEIDDRLSISIAKHQFTYGSDQDLFEACMMLDGQPAYGKGEWSDVKGYLSNDDVAEIITKARSLNHHEFSNSMLIEDGYEEETNRFSYSMVLACLVTVTIIGSILYVLW